MKHNLALKKTFHDHFDITHILEKPHVGFFNYWEEMFLLAVPTLASALTIGFWLLGLFGYEWPVTGVYELFGSIIFLDSVHILFTFVLWLGTPELRKWTKLDATKATSGWAKGMGPWLRSLAIGAAFGAIMFFCKGWGVSASFRGMATVIMLLELLGPAHHTVSQMRGLSFCYNSLLRKRFQFSDMEKELALKSEKFERFLFNLLLAGEILYWLPNVFSTEGLDIPAGDAFQFVGGTMSIASVAGLVINALYFPKQEKSNKVAFLSRVMLFPLKMLSVIGSIGIRAAHGTEYFVVFRKVVQSSDLTAKRRSRLYNVAILISLLYLVPFCVTWTDVIHDMTDIQIQDQVLIAALIGTFALRFMHYYMDAVMFRMSVPVTRETVAPLLTAPVDRGT